jgi:hypothetical protein
MVKKAQRSFRVEVQRKSGTTIIALRGRITEEATEELERAFQDLSGIVCLDLEVDSVNSYGFLTLVRLMDAAARRHTIEFARCSEIMVDYIQMLNLRKYGRLTSFFAIYICARCEREDLVLVDVAKDLQIDRERGSIEARVLRCGCGGALKIDEPLEFLLDHP